MYVPVNQESTFSENLLFAQLHVAFSPVGKGRKIAWNVKHNEILNLATTKPVETNCKKQAVN